MTITLLVGPILAVIYFALTRAIRAA